MWSIVRQFSPTLLSYFGSAGGQSVGDLKDSPGPLPGSSRGGCPLSNGQCDCASLPTSRQRWCCSSQLHLGSCWWWSRLPVSASQHLPWSDRFGSHGLSTPVQHHPPKRKKASVGLTRSLTPVSFTLDSKVNILGKKQSAIVVPCQITCVAWWRQSLGAFQSKTPIQRRDNKARSLILVWSTWQSHSAPQIMCAQSQSSKNRFRYTLHHHCWWAASASSPSFKIPWKVSWVI